MARKPRTPTQTDASASAAAGRLAALPSARRPIDRVDFVALAFQYAEDVVAQRVPAGPFVRAAAERHLRDFDTFVLDKAYKYLFDPHAAARVCRFIETLPHTKGRWAASNQLIELQPWQLFLVVVLFGWLRKDNGKRRFRKVYWEIPRKNGKSLLAAAIGLYMTVHDNEFGAEVYSGATTEKQAWEVFRPARLMAIKTPKLLNHFGLEVWAKQILRPRDGSKFEPIIGTPGDGSSPSCAIVDEFHEHDTPALYDTMETGMGAREQPLLIVITTAGYNVAGPCHELHDEVVKVLRNVVELDDVFGCIFGIDEKDDWADPKSLIKANPNYGVSVDGEFLLAQQRQAMANPVYQTKFKTKHLNVWCSVLQGLMNMQQWAVAADPMLDEDELAGEDAFIAIDLASKSDLCTEQRLYRKYFDGQAQPHYYLFGTYWLPEAAVEEEGPNQMHYRKWVKTGHLIQTDGATIDFEEITEHVIASSARINPKEVVYDPHIATQMANALLAARIEAVEFTQTPHNFTVPVDELLAALKDGRFHHDGNPITTWCFSNTVARPARKGMVAPTKQKGKAHQKIDGAVAAIMAMGRACASKREQQYFLSFV